MFDKLNDMIDRGVIHSIYIGKSVTERKRFATLVTGAGDTVAKGVGDTCEDALADALCRATGNRPVQHRPAKVETRPMMPGIMTR